MIGVLTGRYEQEGRREKVATTIGYFHPHRIMYSPGFFFGSGSPFCWYVTMVLTDRARGRSARARIILSIDDEFAQSLFEKNCRKYADFLSTRKMDLSIALKGTPDQRIRYLQSETRGANELREATRLLQHKGKSQGRSLAKKRAK